MSSRVLEGHAFARAGVLGNPSDGYFGRTLSVVLRNFRASVVLEPSSEIRIEPQVEDLDVFRSLSHLAETVSRRGYYGGGRLIQATIKVFHDYCLEHDHALGRENFTARYRSSIPRQVGLAGSSAIVTASLRALMSFYEVEIPREEQPTLILSAEVDELGITAGLQDRVVQVYEGLVYMDFSRGIMEELGRGAYEHLDPALLPRMFIAFQPGPSKVSGRALDDVRTRWEKGDREVMETLERIGALATEGKDAIVAGRLETLPALMNENFELRRRIMRIGEADLAMVRALKEVGVAAKLTGSGGAIIGLIEGRNRGEQIRKRLGALGARVIEPEFN